MLFNILKRLGDRHGWRVWRLRVHHRLRRGGLLRIRHANFRVEDSAAAVAVTCVPRQPYRPRTPVYRADGRG